MSDSEKIIEMAVQLVYALNDERGELTTHFERLEQALADAGYGDRLYPPEDCE